MEKITPSAVKLAKVQGRKISMLTAYDYPLAKILDQSGVDIVLVGDSLGNVVLGYKNTRPVTMADMVHHTWPVSRAVKRALLVADLPYQSTSTSSKAIKNAQALKRAGAQAVKIEGTKDLAGIKAIIASGIPVMGHLGLLPQSAREFRLQKSPKIISQAKSLEAAGVFALVLEMVEPDLASQITAQVKIPTIGIGSGPFCDGQVLVTYDLIGLSDWSPKFVKQRLNLKEQIEHTVKSFIDEL